MPRRRRPDVRVELVTPFPSYALPLAWEWVRPALRQMADDFALQNIEALITAAETMEARGGKTWGVLRNGRLCGWLGFEPVNRISGIGHCFFANWAWGKETTDTAVKLCLAQIFEMGYERVSCPVLAMNRSIRSLMRRVGIREEGTLRSFTMCGGEITDLVMAGQIKAEFSNVNHVGFRSAPGRSERVSGSERPGRNRAPRTRVEPRTIRAARRSTQRRPQSRGRRRARYRTTSPTGRI